MRNELRQLIRRMARENPPWGAPRIHGELLNVGYQVAQSTVSRHMPKRRGPPSTMWKTFVRHHLGEIVAMDFFTVNTAFFKDSLNRRAIHIPHLGDVITLPQVGALHHKYVRRAA